jgi:hypothetical protein
MYEVGEAEKRLHQLIDEIRASIDGSSGVILLHMNGEGELDMRMFLGQISVFEWIGALDIAKDFVKNSG